MPVAVETLYSNLPAEDNTYRYCGGCRRFLSKLSNPRHDRFDGDIERLPAKKDGGSLGSNLEQDSAIKWLKAANWGPWSDVYMRSAAGEARMEIVVR